VRRCAIGELAAYLFTTWFDWEIARLLNEIGVRTEQGGSWYAQRVTDYRRTCGRRAA
jgi:hypothetical protein